MSRRKPVSRPKTECFHDNENDLPIAGTPAPLPCPFCGAPPRPARHRGLHLADLHWLGVPRFPLLVIIGAFALAQMIVHFRFFLHIRFRQKREDLQLILFSTLVLILMVGGTVWIMGSLALRMAMPGRP